MQNRNEPDAPAGTGGSGGNAVFPASAAGSSGARKKRVCCPAFGTFHPADPKPDCPGGKLYTAPVVAMDGQTGRMGAVAGQTFSG